MDENREPGKSSEEFGIGSRCDVSRQSRKGAFGKNLFGEVEDARVAGSCSRRRIPGYGDEVQTATDVEFTEEVCGQMNQENHRAVLSEHENSGLKEILTEEKIIGRSVESCGPDEHHAMKKDCVLSPESGELSDEQWDDDNLFQDISDTDFLDVEEFDGNDARSETGFAASLNSVECNVTAIASDFGGGVKAIRNDMLGAWALMQLKTGGLDQKFCHATHGADETQMCTTECTVDTLENWTSSGGIDRLLVSETQKGQNNNTAVDRSNFAQLGKELEEWVQSQLSESQLNGSVLVKPTDEHQEENPAIDRTGKSDQESMATVLHSWVRDNQQPRREDSSGFSMAVEQKVERRIASRYPEIAKLLLENRLLSWKEWSTLEASGQQAWQHYRTNGSYSGRGGHPFNDKSKKVFVYKCTSVS